MAAKDENSDFGKTEQSQNENNLSELESGGTKTKNMKYRNTMNLKVKD